MIEGTPGQPYGGTMSEFNTVEDNMRKRRKEATSLLGENQALCTITSFPRLVPTLTCPSRHFGTLDCKENKSWSNIWPYILILYRQVILYVLPLIESVTFELQAVIARQLQWVVRARSSGVRAFVWTWLERLWKPPWLICNVECPPKGGVEWAERLPHSSDPVRSSQVSWWLSSALLTRL